MNFGDITPELMKKLNEKTLNLYSSDQTRKFSVVAIIRNSIPLLSAKTYFENMYITNSVFKDELYFIVETKLAYIAIEATNVLKDKSNNLYSSVLDLFDLFLRREEQNRLDGIETITAKIMLKNRHLIIIPKPELVEVLNTNNKPAFEKLAEEVISAAFDGRLYGNIAEAVIEETPEEFCAILSYYREAHLRLEPIPGAFYIPFIQKMVQDEEDSTAEITNELHEILEKDESRGIENSFKLPQASEEIDKQENERLNLSLAKLLHFLENTMI